MRNKWNCLRRDFFGEYKTIFRFAQIQCTECVFGTANYVNCRILFWPSDNTEIILWADNHCVNAFMHARTHIRKQRMNGSNAGLINNHFFFLVIGLSQYVQWKILDNIASLQNDRLITHSFLCFRIPFRFHGFQLNSEGDPIGIERASSFHTKYFRDKIQDFRFYFNGCVKYLFPFHKWSDFHFCLVFFFELKIKLWK